MTRAALILSFVEGLAALLLAGAAQAQQVPNPMAKDAANAQQPEAMTNLLAGGAITGTVAVNGASLTVPDVRPFAVRGTAGYQGIARFNFGTEGAPLPASYTSGVRVDMYGNATSGDSNFTTGLWSESRLSAGSKGLAVGLVGIAYNEGTWTGEVYDGAIGVWADGHSSRGSAVYAVAANCKQTGLAGGSITCIEIDTTGSADLAGKMGLAINAGDNSVTTGTPFTINGSAATVKPNSAFFVQGLAETENWQHILLTVQQSGVFYRPPVNTTGTLWRAGGFPVVSGLDWHDMTFTGNAIDVGAGKVKAGGIQATALPANCTGQPTGTLWNDAGTVKVVSALTAVEVQGDDPLVVRR